MQLQNDRLRTFLLDSGLVKEEDLVKALKEAEERKIPLRDVLIASQKITEEGIRRVEAYAQNIPFISLKDEKIAPEILSLIPEPIARNHNIVAYNKKGNELEIAMLDVNDLPVIDFIKKKVGLKILPRLTDVASIKIVLTQYKKSLQADFDAILKNEAKSISLVTEGVPTEAMGEKELKKMAEDLPIVKVVDTLVSHAILQNASDIHIEPEEESLIVRYRIDGILHDAMTFPKEATPGIIARIKVLSNLKLDEKRLPQDGRFKIIDNDQRVSFRVSTLPTYFGEKIVIRILKESTKGFTLEKLGFHGTALDCLHDGMHQREGMLLAAGPTGSGKTTTLYTMLDILNTPDVNISTVEDPIEYQMPRINQTQVKPEIGMTFPNALRSLLRQDPDILMVGEIRDGETASLAVNASLTGHLVLSTIHTNSAAGAIPRLIDMGVEPFLIVSTLKVIIAQRLVRKLTETKEQYFLSEAEHDALAKIIDLDRMLDILKKEKVVPEDARWDTIPFYKPQKSEESEDGYHGRIGIHEVLKVTSPIKEIILKGGTADAVEKQAKSEGMMTMLEDGLFFAAQGITTTEEVLRVVSE